MRSLYIHTPFCVHKCHYCDFYSFVDSRDQQAAFVDRLIDELRVLAPHAGRLDTIFVGGGTPSLLRVDLWERLLRSMHELMDLSGMKTPARRTGAAGTPEPMSSVRGEFTVECNPESTSAELLGALLQGGVNRVSIGAQSFNPAHLKTLERWHDPSNVARALELARSAGIERRSVDLIFAIPGQSVDDWDADLRTAIELGTTHLSCYNLTYEPNTAMTKRLEQGEFDPIDDETEAAMYELAVARLGERGLQRYEVSNFALPGHESRHNLAYWRQEQWLAAGPSASAHLLAGPTLRAGSWRYKNVPRLGDYLASTGYSPVVDLETPDPLRLVRERIMMGLRIREGLDYPELCSDIAAIDAPALERLRQAVHQAEQQGLLAISNDRLLLTHAGFLVADAVASDLMLSIKEPDARRRLSRT